MAPNSIQNQNEISSHAWEHLPSTIADQVFNQLEPRHASTARLVCQSWRHQLSATRRTLRPSSARLIPRGWSARLPSLQRLDLSNCPKEGLTAHVVHEASRVRELVTPKGLVDDHLPPFGSLSALERLDLSGCDKLSGSTISALMACKCLRSLDLSGCKRLTATSLALLGGLTGLTFLSISRCERLSDTALRMILPNMRQLTSLAAAKCPQVTDAGLMALRGLRDLTYLDVSGCQRLTDAALLGVSHLTELKCLKIARCEQLRDIAPLQHVTALECLDLSGCPHIGDHALHSLGSLPAIQALRFNRCERITDAGLEALLPLAPSLTSLQLNNCRAVSDQGMVVIGQLWHLQHLSLSGLLCVTEEVTLHPLHPCRSSCLPFTTNAENGDRCASSWGPWLY